MHDLRWKPHNLKKYTLGFQEELKAASLNERLIALQAQEGKPAFALTINSFYLAW
jgi:hypothetical protein